MKTKIKEQWEELRVRVQMTQLDGWRLLLHPEALNSSMFHSDSSLVRDKDCLGAVRWEQGHCHLYPSHHVLVRTQTSASSVATSHLWPWSCCPSPPTSIPRESTVMVSSALQGQRKQTELHHSAPRAATLCTPCMGKAGAEKNFNMECFFFKSP